MSSEIDHPRQRTVAELLAEHGAGGASVSGRRRRRREAEDEPPSVSGSADSGTGAWAPDRSVLREPVPPTLTATAPPASLPYRVDLPTPGATLDRPAAPRFELGGAAEAAGARPTLAPRPAARHPGGADAPPWRPAGRPRPDVEQSTEQMPRLRGDGTTMLDPGLTGPIEYRKPAARAAAVGLVPDDVRERAPRRTSDVPPSGGARRRRGGDDGGPPTQASALFDLDDDHPAGLDEVGLHDEEAEPDELRPPARATSPGQAWAGVVAQWILGAVGGAALWVGFRFLWQELTVVAIAAAVLVTIGLVLVVRHLLRSDDRRTTLFAVLVGLLLTVSPAVLVLLHRP